MPVCRPVLTSDVPAVPPNLTNGPEADVELNTWYHVAPADAVQDMVIEVDDFAVAVTPVGAAGGAGFVVAEDDGFDCADVPPVFDAVTTK